MTYVRPKRRSNTRIFKKKKKKSSANVLCFRLTRYLYILFLKDEVEISLSLRVCLVRGEIRWMKIK